MKHATLILFLFTLSIFSQEPIEATLIKKTLLNAEYLVSVNNFGTSFYINNNVLYKIQEDKTLNYNNLQLGNIESANTFNPLKINQKGKNN